MAAAAEYARACGTLDAFGEVDKLPGWLGGTSRDGQHSNLFHLFQPQRALSGLYAVAPNGLGKSGARKWLAILCTALLKFPMAALIGIAPGVGTAFVACGISAGWLHWLGFALAVVVGVTGLMLGSILGVGRQAAAIPKHRWGVCSGMGESGGGDAPALVPWLAGYLDRIAEKKEGEPLTFGDLQNRGINLQVITTNLTNGKPSVRDLIP